MRGFKRNLLEQMNQEPTEMVSFRQDKFAIGDQEYDLTKPLTYEQALSHIKTILKWSQLNKCSVEQLRFLTHQV